MESIDIKVKEILSVVLGISDISAIESVCMNTDETWDSMKQLTIVTALENEFDIFIDAADAVNLISFESISSFLINHPELD